jgi:mutator protein MutT
MDSNLPKVVPVACAIIEYRYKYLICKRAPERENQGLWEFPGGKVKDNESLKDCIERELYEELGVKSEALSFLASTETEVDGQIIRLYGLRVVLEHEPEAAKLKDHSEIQWVSFEKLSHFALTKPDLALLHELDIFISKEREIAHFDVWSVARLYGFFYGLFGTLMGIYVLFSTQLQISGLEGFAKFSRFAIVLFLPFLNFALGAIAGACFSLLYNLLSATLGGIKMRVR